ncbi:thioesterase family protein [Pontibacillus salicampi]|uniref:Thioesterase family protein n=1 Tax=Pontibacillus salicampi TaxID=1449801 RepID=A0ABV6LPZ9_9BACI
MTSPNHYQAVVSSEWVDYNGHMNDAEYARVFSNATDAFIEWIGLDEKTRAANCYTIYTLETHLCYKQEMHEGDKLTIGSQLLDLDDKRIHLFLTMYNEQGEIAASQEQMLMGIDQQKGKGAAFPEAIHNSLLSLFEKDRQSKIPKNAGRTIGIRRK